MTTLAPEGSRRKLPWALGASAALMAATALAVGAAIDLGLDRPARLVVLAQVYPAVFGLGLPMLARLVAAPLAPSRRDARLLLACAVVVAVATLPPPDGSLLLVAGAMKCLTYSLWVFVLEPLDLAPVQWLVSHSGLLWVTIPTGIGAGALYGLLLDRLAVLARVSGNRSITGRVALGGAVAGLASALTFSALAEAHWSSWSALALLSAGYAAGLVLARPSAAG